MIHYRLREWGAAEWTDLVLSGDLEAEASAICGSALDTSPYHVQRLSDEGEWENV